MTLYTVRKEKKKNILSWSLLGDFIVYSYIKLHALPKGNNLSVR